MNIFSKAHKRTLFSWSAIKPVILFLTLGCICAVVPEWGFFGHRKINRMAVFTLPSEMIGFYKTNIEYVTEHAVDPDKRRYATKFEAIRHYIDIDHWGEYPFDNVPRDFASAFLKFAEINVVQAGGDTIKYAIINCWEGNSNITNSLDIKCDQISGFFYDYVNPNYYEDQITCNCENLSEYLMDGEQYKLTDCESVIFDDKFSPYGILPYWLPQIYNNLVKAMAGRNEKSILRLSSDIGHYIGDAHVPLHTTENYNGQFTDQIGIHAFWESRLPELFAEEEYDFFVGKATYIEDVYDYSWEIVLRSHSFLDEVLLIEKELSQTYPSDQQFCFDERNERTIQTQCKEYSRSYHQTLDGMVEEQMRRSIRAIGSFWYSAWLDAGQPDLDFESVEWTKEDQEKQEELEDQFRSGNNLGRSHQG